MSGLSIGQVARQVGLAASALRYYEKAGLVPPPSRTSKRRRYDQAVLGRLQIIRLAREAGFTIRETRQFLTGFPSDLAPSARWRAMASKKLAQLKVMQLRIAQMKSILEASFTCRCLRIQDCERLMAVARRRR
jgi:MerR family redox-sensitive transcriptional activator SoxR